MNRDIHRVLQHMDIRVGTAIDKLYAEMDSFTYSWPKRADIFFWVAFKFRNKAYKYRTGIWYIFLDL